MPTLSSLELELKALKTVLTPQSEWGSKLFSACKPEFFHSRVGRTIYERLATLLESGQMELPSHEFLLQDPKIPENVRETAKEAFRETPVVENSGDYEYLIGQLSKLSKARALYEGTATAANAILGDGDETKKDDLKDLNLQAITDKLGETILSVDDQDDLISHLQIGRGYNQEAEDSFQRILHGEFARSLIKTGFMEFDEKTGGHNRTNLVVVGANSGGGKCQYFQALIPTNEGIIKIKNLHSDFSEAKNSGWSKVLKPFSVYTRQGTMPVDAVFKGEGQILEVKTRWGDRFKGLAEHKLLCADSTNGTLIYKRLDEITTADWLFKPIGTRLFASETKQFNYNLTNVENSGCKEVLQFPQCLTEDLATVFGLVVAEGTARTNNFTNYDEDLHKFINRSLSKHFGVDPNSRHEIGNRETKFGKLINGFLTQFIGDGKSGERFVPRIIFEAPEKHQCAFLRGLFEGDGSVYPKPEGKKGKKFKNRWCIEYGTISEQLAYDIKSLLDNMGIFCELTTKDTWATNGGPNQVAKTCYRIFILKEGVLDFANKIGFMSERKNSVLNTYVDHLQKVFNDEMGQNTNHKVFGLCNYVPAMQLIKAYLNRALDLSEQTTTVIAQKSSWSDALAKSYTKKVGRWHLFYPNDHIKKILTSTEDYLSKYTCKFILDAHKQPKIYPEVRQLIEQDEELIRLRDKILNLCNFIWAKVTKVAKEGEVCDVYDLSVPGPHEYAADGLMSHNSLYAVNLLARQYRLGYNVILVSYEMAEDEVLVRLLANISEVNMNKLITGKLTPEEKQRVEVAYREFTLIGAEKGNTYSIICPRGETTVAEIGFRAKGLKPDSLILDYINLLNSPKYDSTSQWQQLGQISRESKLLANKLNCVVYLLAQIDETYNLRYSRGIKDHANFVMGWIADDKSMGEGLIKVQQMKARNAPLYPFDLIPRFDIAQFRDPGQEDRTSWPTEEEYWKILNRLGELSLLHQRSDIKKIEEIEKAKKPRIVEEPKSPEEQKPEVVNIKEEDSKKPKKAKSTWSTKDIVPVDITELELVMNKRSLRDRLKQYKETA